MRDAEMEQTETKAAIRVSPSGGKGYSKNQKRGEEGRHGWSRGGKRQEGEKFGPSLLHH